MVLCACNSFLLVICHNVLKFASPKLHTHFVPQLLLTLLSLFFHFFFNVKDIIEWKGKQERAADGESFSAGENGKHHNQSFEHDFADGSKGTLSWEEVFGSCSTSFGVGSQREHFYTLDGNVSITKNHMISPSSHL